MYVKKKRFWCWSFNMGAQTCTEYYLSIFSFLLYFYILVFLLISFLWRTLKFLFSFLRVFSFLLNEVCVPCPSMSKEVFEYINVFYVDPVIWEHKRAENTFSRSSLYFCKNCVIHLFWVCKMLTAKFNTQQTVWV